ncbi:MULTISPECIES: cation:proton antiporter domain-containing protein [unclassified Halomonas]|uniref:cation:proton antiporter domain-containing protein n=1 Tax=unclassified Halomonas TaxID=2609666 RepID=UPI00099055EA|nr:MULTISPECIES: cation:proton antiporter [unclassified Halomonas]AQU82275.1 sodium:proton exchanger [Halomonas sp. 'Soap Lake \
MLEQTLVQTLILLGVTVFVVLLFQRFRIPPSLAYLLVGVILGSHTAGPAIETTYIPMIAEFGIVFLLFTIGLSFPLPQIYALRHTILSLGTAQVVLTTAAITLLAWAIGLPLVAAFIVGAVFTQSSTTIISKQLAEQGESQTRHGRLGTTMSVFQDITAVPFVVVIPVLGSAAASQIGGALGIALLKAIAALGIVLISGRYLLKPLFHIVAKRRSAELFTLTVLFVSLIAAWTTNSLGLSMAFGAFLAGMVLGETEFRHQVETTIRPFRDVLLGLFFISIGMLVEPALLPSIWYKALLGAAALLIIKTIIVTLIVRYSGIDSHTAFRTGLTLAVGGEFGFALLSIGLDHTIIATQPAQITLTAVLFSMIVAPFLIRYNQPLAAWLFKTRARYQDVDAPTPDSHSTYSEHVIICGYGRTGQVISRFLESESIRFVAIDMDPSIVKEARLAGHPVFYGDASDPVVLESIGLANSTLLIISHDDRTATIRTLHQARDTRPDLPVVVRTYDDTGTEELRKAGATEVIPETLESGMVIAMHSLLTLNVPMWRVTQRLQEQRIKRYPMLKELFRSSVELLDEESDGKTERLHSVLLEPESACLGSTLGSYDFPSHSVTVTALVRDQERFRYPDTEIKLKAGDVLVLLGTSEALEEAERRLSEFSGKK